MCLRRSFLWGGGCCICFQISIHDKNSVLLFWGPGDSEPVVIANDCIFIDGKAEAPEGNLGAHVLMAQV